MGEKSNYTLALEELTTADDRTCAVVGLAFLDDGLAFAIRQTLGLNQEDKATLDLLERSSSPLGSFWSRVLLLRAIGVIGSRTKANLQVLSDIRNKFAHRLSHRSFDDPAIAALVDKLDHDFPPAAKSNREKFYALVHHLAHRLDLAVLIDSKAYRLD